VPSVRGFCSTDNTNLCYIGSEREHDMARRPAQQPDQKVLKNTVETVHSRNRSHSDHMRTGQGLQESLNEVLSVAQDRGLLSGSKTQVIRGRMPAGLIEQAKRKSGIVSDTKLLEAALANLAVYDDYAQWLLAQRATVSPDLDLEF
jgi:hypothetical protein